MKKLATLGTAALVAFGLLVAVGPAAVAATTVSCTAGQPNNLQSKINGAAAGTTLDITGVCTGKFTIPKDLTLNGGTLDGNNTGPVLFVHTGVTATVEHQTIQHGNNAGNAGSGGGIVNDGTLTLDAVTIRQNTAGDSGGGIANFGSLTINGSTVSDNVAFAGGGIWNDGSSATITNSIISGNTTNNTNNGGGIENSRDGLTIISSKLLDNGAVNGGAIDTDALTTVRNSTISGNQVSNKGGGILVFSSTTTVTSSAISDNAAADGGGVYNFATLSLQSTGVHSNTASNLGGGVDNSRLATFSQSNSSITNNTPDNICNGC